jgi:hypothetical protein
MSRFAFSLDDLAGKSVEIMVRAVSDCSHYSLQNIGIHATLPSSDGP